MTCLLQGLDALQNRFLGPDRVTILKGKDEGFLQG